MEPSHPSPEWPPRFVVNQPVAMEEDLTTEFKEVTSQNPASTIIDTVEDYAVAFLNGEGGRIFWGIRDSDRCAVGVALDAGERDQVRKGISYSAQPRRTRRARAGYLSTWLDWISSRRGEREDEFRARALVDAGERGDEEGAAIPWQLASNRQHGVIRGVHRHGGTAQKDWAFLQSNEMPEALCVAVRGHSGWASDTIDAKAKFALVVGFEAIAGDLPIYVPVRTEIEARAAVRVEI